MIEKQKKGKKGRKIFILVESSNPDGMICKRKGSENEERHDDEVAR